VARWGALEVDCTVSAGPAFLHTGVGDAVGFDGGVGLVPQHDVHLPGGNLEEVDDPEIAPRAGPGAGQDLLHETPDRF